MARARITFTDIVGAATLQSDWPEPGDVFGAWTPTSVPVGQSGHAQDDATPSHSRTSWRYGATFEVRGLGMGAAGASALDIADRLIGHLLSGGTCGVTTEDALGSTYATCGLMPDTEPALALANPRTIEYTLSLALINLADSPVPMICHYGPVIATGGTESTIVVNNRVYRLHVFTTSGTLTVTKPFVGDYLLVAGGGSGGGVTGTGVRGGGGGAGEVIDEEDVSVSAGAHSITIGAGATGDTDNGAKGSDSSFGTIDTAEGGGFGASVLPRAGGAGGCGGGAGADDGGAAYVGGVGTQGDGGNAGVAAGGGGGAGGNGANGGAANGGAGGAGVSSDITGSSVTYGVGGDGADTTQNAAGAAGTANRGNGGEGAASTSGSKNGGDGGSGYFAIRYPLSGVA